MKAQACDMYLWTMWQIYSTLHTLQDYWLNCSRSLHQLSSDKLLSTVCIVDCYQWRSPLPNTDITINSYSIGRRRLNLYSFCFSGYRRTSKEIPLWVKGWVPEWLWWAFLKSNAALLWVAMLVRCAVHAFNTLRLRRNRRHFADDIFKYIHLNENALISIKIPLKFIPKTPINNMPTLVQIMAWHRQGAKPLSETMMVKLSQICVTRAQWVNRISRVWSYDHRSMMGCSVDWNSSLVLIWKHIMLTTDGLLKSDIVWLFNCDVITLWYNPY